MLAQIFSRRAYPVVDSSVVFADESLSLFDKTPVAHEERRALVECLWLYIQDIPRTIRTAPSSLFSQECQRDGLI
jgi:hypothetical protein